MGNYHARFLGGWAQATAPGYPPSCVKTFAPETAGVKVEQPQLAVARAASDLQSRPPKIGDANHHERLIKRQRVKESKWRYTRLRARVTVPF